MLSDSRWLMSEVRGSCSWHQKFRGWQKRVAEAEARLNMECDRSLEYGEDGAQKPLWLRDFSIPEPLFAKLTVDFWNFTSCRRSEGNPLKKCPLLGANRGLLADYSELVLLATESTNSILNFANFS